VRTGSRYPRLILVYDGKSLRRAHAQACGQLGKPVVGTQCRDAVVEAHRLFLQSLTLRGSSRRRVAQTRSARRQYDVTHQKGQDAEQHCQHAHQRRVTSARRATHPTRGCGTYGARIRNARASFVGSSCDHLVDPRALRGAQFGAAGTAVFGELVPIGTNRPLRKNLESLVVAETSFHNSILE
jgi:hypothetical protein